MSLRVRLIASIVLVLLAGLCVGGAVAGWHAARSVRTEMKAALAVGAQTLRNAVGEPPASPDAGDAELGRLVHAFDGDRHVRAVLRDAAKGSAGEDGEGDGARIASRLRPATVVLPGWFVAALAPALAPARLDVGGGRAIELEADPRNEIGEVWTQFQDDLVAAALSGGLSVALVSLVVGRALRPLDRLSAALVRLGEGEYAVRLPSAGPPELARLADGFNTMAGRLDEARARNARLDEQLLSLQEEERADIARDLHDEVGPFLFAVNLDAAAIERAAAGGDIPERARAIRDSVGHMQRHVRDMLLRLRPASPVEVGLGAALENLAAFWRARQPEIAFAIDVAADEDAIGAPALAAIYRLAREAMSNAVRHGKPSRIDVSVRADDDGDISVRVADDGGGFVPSGGLDGATVGGHGLAGHALAGHGLAGHGLAGQGLIGMRERVAALDGVLRVMPGEGGGGLVVTARIPGRAMAKSAA